MLIELLWSKLSKLEELELACQDCCVRLALFLSLAANAKMHLKCHLHNTMTVAWYYDSFAKNIKLFTNLCATKTMIITCT